MSIIYLLWSSIRVTTSNEFGLKVIKITVSYYAGIDT